MKNHFFSSSIDRFSIFKFALFDLTGHFFEVISAFFAGSVCETVAKEMTEYIAADRFEVGRCKFICPFADVVEF